jgi:salicylate hydroxylase
LGTPFISGAGIAGLVLAVALTAFDKDEKIAIDLYDAVPELSEIGAGIHIWPRTWQVLQEIGLGDALVPFLDHYPDLQPSTFNSLHVCKTCLKACPRNNF